MRRQFCTAPSDFECDARTRRRVFLEERREEFPKSFRRSTLKISEPRVQFSEIEFQDQCVHLSEVTKAQHGVERSQRT